MNLLSNPEILRNARIQLRPRKMLVAAGICAVVEVALGYAFFSGNGDIDIGGVGYSRGQALMHTILWIQALVLVIGGGIACLHSIQREKDQNTFDFQRITRLSPLELTLGKLFGAPLMVFFVFLCLMPAAIVGAVSAGAAWTIFVAAYALLILGSLAYLAFAVVISLFLRRGAVTWAILFFLFFVVYTSSTSLASFYLSLGSISPFNAISLAHQTSWSVSPGVIHIGAMTIPRPDSFQDLFFGISVHHALVLFLLYVTILAWLIPAVARNIKRDPANYELYTPGQALGFLCYLNFILFAFFRWGTFGLGVLAGRSTALSPLEAQSVLLTANILLFFIFGFILLRNRNQARRLLHSGAAGRLETWPASYLFLGALLIGIAMILVIQWQRDPSLEWSLSVGIFRIAYFAFWLICDFLFLQWAKIQRAGHPLAMGVLYLGVYYACAIIIVLSLHASHSPFAAIFLPTPLFALDTAAWSAHLGVWIAALILQIAAGVVFVALQRRTLAELQPHSSSISMNAPATNASL